MGKLLVMLVIGAFFVSCDDGPHGYYPPIDYPYTYPFKVIIKNESNKFTLKGDGANFSIDTMYNLSFDSGRPTTRMQLRSTDAHAPTTLTLTYSNNGSWVDTKSYVVDGTHDWQTYTFPNSYNELHIILGGYSGDLELILEAY